MNIFFWRKTPPARTPDEHPLYGVNLGGWLVLEKWMTPSVFRDSPAIDEYTLCESGDEAVRARIARHRDTFITRQDFEWLKEQGVEAVRLPVGYGVFGDEPPYLKTVDYVDKAFEWAEATGLKILLDIHAAPGSQNGWDHSGKAGRIGWYKDERNIIKTLEILKRLTKRYAGRSGLLGIELLNEPKWSVPRRKLLRYYEAAYKMIRAEGGENLWIVFHDSFRPRRWKRKLRGEKYTSVYIDTHQYQSFSKRDKRLDLAGHLHKTLRAVPRVLERMGSRHKVIVGEWSLALDPLSTTGLSPCQLEAARLAYGAAQLIAFESTDAWFYWSYKTEEGGVWSFKSVIENGWLPSLKSTD